MKTALITGATDGIGKEVALHLAKQGYTIHVLGRSSEKGQAVLGQLQKIHMGGAHRFYPVDLLSVKAIDTFIKTYTDEHESLDLLLLNANPSMKAGGSLPAPGGVNPFFMIGHVSRVLLIRGLDHVLAQGKNPKIIHIGDFTMAFDLDLEVAMDANAKPMKALSQSYSANGLVAMNMGRQGLTGISQELMNPGLVLTQQAKSNKTIVNHLMKWVMGGIEPKEAGEIIGDYIVSTNVVRTNGLVHRRDKEKKVSQKYLRLDQFQQLMLSTDKVINKLRAL